MKKVAIVAMIIVSALIISINDVKVYAAETTGKTMFADIENHWATDNIEELANKNIISGYLDGTFRPENNVTVAEFLKMIVEAGEYTLIRSGDLMWPDYYIETAIHQKIIERNEFGDYDKQITRYEIARIIARFIDVNDVKENRNILKDLDENYEVEVLKLVKLKVINGYEDKTYRGENNITRAEVATVLCKAIAAREELILKRKYDITTRYDLSNYKNENETKKSSLKTYFEIKQNDLLIYDDGRYAKLDGYKISDANLNVKKIINVIKSLITEKSYVAVLYSPSKDTTSQVRILYGEDEINTLSNKYDFSFTYYEDKPYELSRISMVPEFSEKCYLKIDVLKMWDESSDYQNGTYVDELKKAKLKSALEAEFGAHAEKILEYMLDKNVKFVTNIDRNKKHIEVKKFGNYTINFYQCENDVPEFYIAK